MYKSTISYSRVLKISQFFKVCRFYSVLIILLIFGWLLFFWRFSALEDVYFDVPFTMKVTLYIRQIDSKYRDLCPLNGSNRLA